jgi:tyrosyl-tRNA synthetase
VRVNDEVVTDVMAVIKPEQLPAVLQVGKRKFMRLVRA